ncbi:MAG: hypothetical protein QM534_01090 [Sediminibacterium sp.]|nr:hypothetical protein [Sediminibacterium sp.]
MKKVFAAILTAGFSLSIAAQTPTPVLNDFGATLHEEGINKVFTAIGDIKGANDYEVMLIKGKYYWTIKNPRINLKPDSSDFTCDAIVDVGPFNYKTQVVGNVKINYDNAKNQISLQISRAIFELYTMIFGKKVHIKDIHLEEYFKDPFVFEGPKTLATDMEFTMPDSTKKKIYIQPTDCAMRVKFREICTTCEILASDKPFKPVIKVVPPIQAPRPADTKTTQPQKK